MEAGEGMKPTTSILCVSQRSLWRIIGVAETDADLITNQLVYLLAQPSQVSDTSWIKPGKVAWDWYNANNIYGVDFKSGINTATYKYYIDFASKHGLEYVILDEGWYKLGNLLQVVPEMNIEELVAYGKQKNVGIVLWVAWKSDGFLRESLSRGWTACILRLPLLRTAR